jgi:hypothetical protein
LTTPGIPGGDTSDQPAAADRNEDGVDIGRLLLEFEAECPLAQDSFVLVERRYRHGAGSLRPCLAGRKRIRVAVALDREVGAVFADALDLRGRGDVGTKIFARLPSFIAA